MRLHLDLDLPAAYEERLKMLAEYRGESVEATAQAIARNVLTRIPRNLRRADRPLSELEVGEVGLADDGTPFIRLTNGRIFYDHPGKPRSVLMYHMMRDKTSPQFTPETYSLGIEVRRLYSEQPPKRHYPTGANAVAVDAGAFVGYKALAYLDALGAGGRVVAIELAPENFALLKRNVEANAVSDRIAIHNVGIWSEPGTITYRGSGWMQYSIAAMDGKSYPSRGTMQTDTLDNIFDRSNISRVDYLNIQVNGAELEALRGLQRWFDKVKVFRIAAYYTKDGLPIVDEIVRALEARGCEVVDRTAKGSVTAVNGAFQG